MSKGKGKPKIAQNVSFEQGIEQLEEIIERIESGEIGLEESLSHYERGMALIAHCKAVLADCEQRVEDLTRELRDVEVAAGEADSEDASDELDHQDDEDERA